MTPTSLISLCYLVPAFLAALVIARLDCDPPLGAKLSKSEQYECIINDLFDPEKYSPLVRPVESLNKTLEVQISIQLSQLVNLDEKNQRMKVNVWVQMYWNDYQLRWYNKRKYSDVQGINIPPERVWLPDIVLFNNVDGNYEVSYRSMVLVSNKGNMSWIPPAIYVSSCTIDVRYFPFDEQQCEMKFGSWTFMDHQLSFTFYYDIAHFDYSDYLENGAWDIIEDKVYMKTNPSIITPDKNKTDIMFKLVLRRKTLFYTVNLVIPCVLISFVTISVFILPAEAGEKITLCISVLLALVVFLLLISKILPPTLTIPLVSQYLLFTFIMNVLAIISTVIIINRNYRTPRTHHMSYHVRLIFLNYLPRLLFMKRPDHDSRWQEVNESDADEEELTLIGQKSESLNRLNKDPDLTKIARRTTQSIISGSREGYVDHPNCRLHNAPQDTEQGAVIPNHLPVSADIFRAAESLKFIHKHLKKDDEYHTVIDDWRYVARVIDRLLLITFFIVITFGTMGIYFKAPYIFKKGNQDDFLQGINNLWKNKKQGS